MAGLGLTDQQNTIAATTPISTAFKFCIRRRKWALESAADITEVRFLCRHHSRPGPQNTF
jgi:hypothetical protein